MLLKVRIGAPSAKGDRLVMRPSCGPSLGLQEGKQSAYKSFRVLDLGNVSQSWQYHFGGVYDVVVEQLFAISQPVHLAVHDHGGGCLDLGKPSYNVVVGQRLHQLAHPHSRLGPGLVGGIHPFGLGIREGGGGF